VSPVKTRYKPSEIAMQNSAEAEIMKFAGSPYLWCKNILGVELDPHQLAWMQLFRRHQNCVLVGSRRIRKSFAVAMYFLMEAATKPWSEVNIHAPAQEQSKRDLKYMSDRILASPILERYIEKRIGEGIGREYVEFANKSLIQAKGQAQSTDGLGATHQWLEEFDDMDWETFMTRIFPTGSQIKPEHPYDDDVRACRRVVTGTIKGEGNLYKLEHPDRRASKLARFEVLPKLDCWYGVAAGIIPEEDIMMARDVLMTPAQFARTYLALYVESKDYFPSRLIKACQDPGTLIAAIDGPRYQARGQVTVGIDFEGHGSGDDASSTTFVVAEQVAGRLEVVYLEEFPAGSNPTLVKERVVRLCEFFRPRAGLGDAYGARELYEINRALLAAGVTRVNPDSYEQKEGAGGWDEWFLAPVRFEGRRKHEMYRKLQLKMTSSLLRYPVLIDDYPPHSGLAKFMSQLENVKAARAKQGYDQFNLIRKALGDDYVDAAALAVWAQSDVVKGRHAIGGAASMGGFKAGKTFAKPSFKPGRFSA